MELGQLRTMGGDLEVKYRALEGTFARIDSLAQTRLNQLNDAGDLAAQMLARIEGVSAETGKQLAAMTDARQMVGRELRELVQARAQAPPHVAAIRTPAAVVVSRINARRVGFGSAITAIHTAASRPSRAAIVYAALIVLAVAAIAATWPEARGSRVEVPVVESRVLNGSGRQLSELPQRLIPDASRTPAARVQPAESPRRATPNSARAAVTGFTGQLTVQSTPRGATVFIDGKPVGETPMSSVRIRAGSHAVWLELPRHQRWTASVQVRAGGLTTVNATLRATESARSR
jgi:hypothetical protein